MLIDYRENRSHIPKLLEQLNIPVQLANITTDYIIGNNCFVERKTVDDFITSIADSRIFQQVRYLAESCTHPLVIIEGDRLYLQGRVHANIISGVILWITLVQKVAVIQTRDEDETARILYLLTKKYGTTAQIIIESLPRKRKTSSVWQRQLAILAIIPGIGRKTAHDLLLEFGSIAAIMRADDSDLINLPCIGKERLAAIRQVFPPLH